MKKKSLHENWVPYLAIIEEDLEDVGWFNVTFPDIYPGVTCGDSLEDAKRMAEDLLALMLDEAPHQCHAPRTIEEVKKLYPKVDEKNIYLITPCYHPPVKKD